MEVRNIYNQINKYVRQIHDAFRFRNHFLFMNLDVNDYFHCICVSNRIREKIRRLEFCFERTLRKFQAQVLQELSISVFATGDIQMKEYNNEFHWSKIPFRKQNKCFHENLAHLD